MTATTALASLITSAFEERANFSPKNAPTDVRNAVDETLNLLDQGKVRVAEKVDGQWKVNEWLKKAVLLSFRLNDNTPMQSGVTQYYDKVPSKYADYDAARFASEGVRVVPPAFARRGAYIAPNAVLMPSYVNIGAYVGDKNMTVHVGNRWFVCTNRQERASLWRRRHRRRAL